MDFYISNNLTKSEFKARLSRQDASGQWENLSEGYPYLNFSFRKNSVAFLFYSCRQSDAHTAVLESAFKPEAYSLVFKSEECTLTFAHIVGTYLKMRGLIRRQSQQGAESAQQGPRRVDAGRVSRERRALHPHSDHHLRGADLYGEHVGE